MLMLNYDFYDIHAVLLHLRNDPSYTNNIRIAESLKHLIDSPQIDNVTAPNIVRRTLAEMDCLDKNKWGWVYTENIYTYGHKTIKDDLAYRILSQGFEEILLCLKNNDSDRLADLADALHNVPIILADAPKHTAKLIKREISSYRTRWNSCFLEEILKRKA